MRTTHQNQVRMNPIEQFKTLIAQFTIGLLILILTAPQGLAQNPAADFYVAVNGSDNNPGTLDKPFATLQRAKLAVRKAKEIKSDKNYLVYIRAGNYHLQRTVDFDLEDGARAGHHIGEIYWHSHAIILWQSGHNLVRNNYIRDVPRKAICLSGVRFKYFTDQFQSSENKPPREYWKTIRWKEIGRHDDWEDIIKYLHTRNTNIEHNEIENAVNMLGDGSAINISGAGEGNIVRRNFVHSINNIRISAMMRTDDYQKGTVFQENILYDSQVGGITLKGENTVINNYLIDVGTEKGDLIHSAAGWGPFDQSVISKNIFFVPGKQQKFYYRFNPQDVDVLKDSTIDDNIYYCAKSDSTAQEPFLKALRGARHDQHSQYLDPLFRNWRKRDFRLTSNSPAHSLGIKTLSLDTVGLTDEFPSKWR